MLEVKDLVVGYGHVEALHGLTLSVSDGEMVAIIGANGAGKSTTLRAISGVLKPTRGEITFQGRSLVGLSPEKVAACGIAHVPEGRRVFPGMTVLENLQFAGMALGFPQQQIREDTESIYALFPRLKEREKQGAWSLSGGEQQMLVIGRGLIARPKLLMLDEPSLGLAPALVDQVYDCICAIRSRGTSILLVEQNAHMALEVSDRAYVLELGRISVQGKAADLLQSEQVKQSYLG